jgi:hypothetical protein
MRTIISAILVWLCSCATVATPPEKPGVPASPSSSSDVLGADTLTRGELVAANDAETAAGERLEAAAQQYEKHLKEMFERLSEELDACYLPQLKRNPNLAGHIQVEMAVTVKGEIKTEPVITSNTLNNDKVEVCLLKIISEQTYPEPYNSGDIVIKRTFAFGAF